MIWVTLSGKIKAKKKKNFTFKIEIKTRLIISFFPGLYLSLMAKEYYDK